MQRFPMTVGTLINNSAPIVVKYNGTISVAAYGLTNAPFVRKLYISQRDSVVGWGNIETIDQSVMFAPTPFLQTRRVTIRTDSFFLMGAPAPTALLTGLGAMQGRKVLTSRTQFLCESQPYALGMTYSTNSTFTTPSLAIMLVLPPLMPCRFFHLAWLLLHLRCMFLTHRLPRLAQE